MVQFEGQMTISNFFKPVRPFYKKYIFLFFNLKIIAKFYETVVEKLMILLDDIN